MWRYFQMFLSLLVLLISITLVCIVCSWFDSLLSPDKEAEQRIKNTREKIIKSRQNDPNWQETIKSLRAQ